MQVFPRNEASSQDRLGSEQGALAALAAIIPAWQPEPILITIVNSLSEQGFGLVLVVDDGSTQDFAPTFQKLTSLPRVHLIRQKENRGKGSALKSAFGYVLENHPDLLGVVTADADGQHTPEDVARVGQALHADPYSAVLGIRHFGRGIPFRSRFGNIFTRFVFRLLIGSRLADTQSGLRGLSLTILPDLLKLPGNRYEYETTMLAYLCRSKRCPREIPVATVYIEGNRHSHFHPIWDSLQIYRVLMRFYLASITNGASHK